MYFDHISKHIAQVVVVCRRIVSTIGTFVEELDELVESGG